MTALKKPVPFGKYFLLERINVGGMAEVFKAKTFGVEGFERLVAVKRILPNIAEDEEFIAMFIDEAKIAVQLQHANIAQIFDLGKVEDSFFIALEYVNGRDLRAIFDRMRSKGDPLPIALACYVMMQVCEGLDYAHNKRDGQGRELHLIHRDISPQNVLIGYDGEVKLIDFGIAKAAGKASTTQAGILKGKFGYMSPEQVRGLPIDKRSDIFAVGIVLYELLTGERLFVGETDFSTLEKVRNVEIVPPSAYNKKISPELERLILKALARDPEDRYQNAIDLHDDLQSFLYSVGEFYSRKDLSAWMKKTFSAEIEEDNAKLEEFQQVAPAVQAPAEVSRRAAVAGGPPGGRPSGTGVRPTANKTSGKTSSIPGAPAKADGVGAKGKGNGKAAQAKGPTSEMGWDDEELDTQIFDKEPEGEERTLQADDLFFEDDDRTVANEPPPDILEQARPPDLATPKPITLATPEPCEEMEIKLTPPPASRPPGPPVGRKGTLVGVPRANASAAPSGPAMLHPAAVPLPPPPAAPAPSRPTSPLRRSGLNLPPAQVAAPMPSAPSMPPAAAPPVRPAPMTFQPPQSTPFGTGSFMSPPPPARRSRSGLGVAFVLLVVLGGGGGYYAWHASTTKPGRIEISTTPADAVVLVDNVKVGDHSPVALERPPGPYTLSVTREGYVRNDQNIDVKPGQPLPLSVTLAPSPDTGFELTSEPPGGLVWFDGVAIGGANGKQATTDFRAYRIAPGKHVVEIKGETRFKPWRQEVEIQPGVIQKIHATLIPATGGSGKSASSGSGTTREVAQAGTEPPPSPLPSASSSDGAGAHKSARSSSGASAGSASSGASGSSAGSPSGSSAGSSTLASGGTGSSASGSSGASSGRRRRAREVAVDDPASTDDSSKASSDGGDCSITVNSVPWSEVWIDGKNTSKHTPLVEFKLPCGKHKIAFKRADMQIDHSESIGVRAGQPFKHVYTLEAEE
jgi:serine/threonine protein kinase